MISPSRSRAAPPSRRCRPASRRLRSQVVPGGFGVAPEHLDGLQRELAEVLAEAGLITGEALTGILIAIPIVVSGRADVLALPAGFHFGQLAGLAVLAIVGWLLYRSATRKTA